MDKVLSELGIVCYGCDGVFVGYDKIINDLIYVISKILENN